MELRGRERQREEERRGEERRGEKRRGEEGKRGDKGRRKKEEEERKRYVVKELCEWSKRHIELTGIKLMRNELFERDVCLRNLN
jgi:hypothetical protein